MANRYQSFSFTTSSVASAAVLQASQVLGPHCYNLVKLKIVRNTGAGNINFRIFKKGVWGSANRLIRFENQTVPLVQPVDKTSGSPGVEALEGVPLPIDDEDGTNNDGTGKLHYELENLGTTSTFTISGEYEEVVVLSGAGDPSWRGAITALTSLSLRGATSGTAIITAPAVAGTPTLTLPTASGTFARLQDKLSAFAATTSAELAGVISDETGSGALVFATSPTLVTPTLGVATATSIAIGANTLDTNEWANLDGINQTLATTSTPRFARLGLGAAADASHQLLVQSGVSGTGLKILDTNSSIPVLQLSTSITSAGNIRNWMLSANYDASGDFTIREGSAEGNDPYGGTGVTRVRIDRNGNFQPGGDNALDLGASGLRWKDGYFGGTLRYGIYTATPGTITGYITITDAGGTTRKLAVTT